MKPRKAFARLDADVGKLARKHAKENGRTLQSEINFTLRDAYGQTVKLATDTFAGKFGTVRVTK